MPLNNKDYIATKMFKNKVDLENRKNIISNIEQYTGVNGNVALEIHSKLHNNVKNNIYRVKKNGKIDTIAEARERRKAKRDNTPKTLILLGIVPGLILFFILYAVRNKKFKEIKDEELKQLKSSLVNVMETNPLFLKTVTENIDNLKGEEKKLYENCIRHVSSNIGQKNIDGKKLLEDAMDETLDFLRILRDTNVDKALLEQMCEQVTPNNMAELLKQEQKKNKNLKISMDKTISSPLFIKKYQEKEKQTTIDRR